MRTEETELHEGPEMDALRELRADIGGPTEAQRQDAWERVQGAGSQASARGRKGGSPWLVLAAAAVAAGVVAVGIGVAVVGGDDQPAPPATTSTQTNPNPSPYTTGAVWDPADAQEKARLERLAREHIHVLPEGGVRIELPEEGDSEALTKALNAEGIPVRLWPVLEEEGYWETAPEYPIDPDDGLDTSKEPTGSPYPMEDIDVEREDGAGTAVTSFTFHEIPTEPVDIQYAE